MNKWKRDIKGQVRVGEDRGYLHRNTVDPNSWKWKRYIFSATNREQALNHLMGLHKEREHTKGG
jgi:hypothetical protein